MSDEDEGGEVSVPQEGVAPKRDPALAVRVADGNAEAEYAAVENAAVPLLSKMKSGPRICRELGFSLGGAAGSGGRWADSSELTRSI